MISIETLPQYKTLISENKKRFAKIDTNCFLMSGSVAPIIAEGRMSAECYEKGLCVFVEEGSYRNLYYFWDAASELTGLPHEKPLLVEELSSEGREEHAKAAEIKLLQAGFKRFKKNLQFVLQLEEMRAILEEEYPKRLERLQETGIKIVSCTTAFQAEQTVALWRNELDETDIPESHTQFLTRENDQVVCAINEANEVVGAYWWNTDGKSSCEGRHIVTRADHLRRGIATVLLMYAQRDLLERGVDRITTWISTSNEKSIFLHERAGFRTNGKISTQYILK